MFLRELKDLFTIIIPTLRWIYILVSKYPDVTNAYKEYPSFVNGFELQASAQIRPNGQGGALEGSVWEPLLLNHPQRTENFLEIWYHISGDAGNQKSCWLNSTHYRKSHEKASERQGQNGWYRYNPKIASEAGSEEACYGAEEHDNKKENHCKAWEARYIWRKGPDKSRRHVLWWERRLTA